MRLHTGDRVRITKQAYVTACDKVQRYVGACCVVEGSYSDEFYVVRSSPDATPLIARGSELELLLFADLLDMAKEC